MDRPSAHYDNTSIVSDPILRCRTLWTAVVCGKVIMRSGFVITLAQAGILHGLPGEGGQLVTCWVT